jgi:hypothetical protein
MSKTKVIVLMGSSAVSWEDAVRQVARKAWEIVGEITSLDVVHHTAIVEEGKITEFRATVHVTFDLQPDGSPEPAPAADAVRANP